MSTGAVIALLSDIRNVISCSSCFSSIFCCAAAGAQASGQDSRSQWPGFRVSAHPEGCACCFPSCSFNQLQKRAQVPETKTQRHTDIENTGMADNILPHTGLIYSINTGNQVFSSSLTCRENGSVLLTRTHSHSLCSEVHNNLQTLRASPQPLCCPCPSAWILGHFTCPLLTCWSSLVLTANTHTELSLRYCTFAAPPVSASTALSD